MKKYLYLLLSVLSLPASAQFANGKIKVYFNRPVDNALAANYPAVFVNQTLSDTLCAYINKAKYSIDVAQYDYLNYAAVTNVATAINNAYTRGVTVRWIYNGSSPNSALSLLNSNIKKLASPTGNGYGIMHDKFVIVDANSSSASDAFVWTGSADWSQQQMDSDVNNIIVFQDQPLARAYTAEFNQMWGGSGSTPVTANEKFGPNKVDLGPHIFTIGGSTVELYFSPKDSTNDHILDAINSSNSQLFFGVYTFTETNDANAIVARKNAGVVTAGIIDQYSSSYSAAPILSAGLGNKLKTYTQSSSIYHSKFVIADPCNTASDPLVLTGSHNWTSSADTKNDENTVVIHNADVANIYYQAFFQNFADLGGVLAPCAVSNPCNISASAAVNNNIACYGLTTGNATVHAHGTHGPFSYRWSSTPAQTDSVLINVAAGNYSVTVMDGNSCSATAYVTISQPSAIEINSLATEVSCLNGSNGSIAVTVNGGAGSYRYLWSTAPQQNTATASGLSAGSYVISVTDNQNCTSSASFTVTQPDTGITVSTSVMSSGCGATTGSVTANVLTGMGSFTYQWSNGSTVAVIGNVAAGSYSVTVSTAGGCSATASALVNSTGGPSVVASSTNTTCGINNGAATVTVTGGSQPYTFSWTNGGTASSINVLSAGLYTVTVNDNNHCASIASVTVNASNALVLNATSYATYCSANNGSATVTVSNASNPVFSWSNGGTNSTISNIAAGNYNVTVSDGGICSASATVTVSAGSGVTSFAVTADKTTLCYGDSANLCAIPGYTNYIWSNNNSGSCVYVNQAGSYSVTASNNSGCSATSTPISITVFPVFNISFVASGDSLFATSAVNYQWQLNNIPINGATSQSYIATQSGNYSVIGEDANHCTATSNEKYVAITGLDILHQSSYFHVYPNPLSGGNFQLDVSNEWIGSRLEVFDAGGKLIFNSEIGSLRTELLGGFSQGIYLLKVTSGSNTIVKKIIRL